MKKILPIALSLLFFCGCATWQGIKQDANETKNWTKEKVHEGASYIKEKTE